jgi:hypothetical protein
VCTNQCHVFAERFEIRLTYTLIQTDFNSADCDFLGECKFTVHIMEKKKNLISLFGLIFLQCACYYNEIKLKQLLQQLDILQMLQTRLCNVLWD